LTIDHDTPLATGHFQDDGDRFLESARAALIASSASTEQRILTGGKFSSCTISVFLIVPASSIVLPSSHSVDRLELAIADH
jgi:hypothetical protein